MPDPALGSPRAAGRKRGAGRRVPVAGDVAIEEGEVARRVEPAGGGGLAAPGFVDVHINGVAGIDFLAADEAGYRRAAEALASTGVVGFQPTFISSPLDAYRRPWRPRPRPRRPRPRPPALPPPVGVHLEGPFLSPEWPGAHDPAYLLAPDPELATRSASRARWRWSPSPPSCPGALELVDHLARRGGRLLRALRRRCGDRPRRLRPRRARDHAHLQRPQALATARPRARGGGDRAPGRVRRGDRRRGPPGSRGRLRDFLASGGRYCLVTDAVEAAMGARATTGSATAGSRSSTARRASRTARWPAAC